MSPREPAAAPREADLVCTRCGAEGAPSLIEWSQAEGKLVHAQAETPPVAKTIRRICGGQLVPKNERWRHTFAPGIIVRAVLHNDERAQPHRVRLGHPADAHATLWSGTALCGLQHPVHGTHWRPLSPEAAAHAETCPACETRASTTEVPGGLL